MPVMSSGATTGPFAVAVAGFMPSTSLKIHVTVTAATGQTSWVYSNSNGIPLAGAQASSGGNVVCADWFIVESAYIYWQSSGSGTLACNGWEDNF